MPSAATQDVYNMSSNQTASNCEGSSIVCHPDRIVLGICSTDNNIEFLRNRFGTLAIELSMQLSGTDCHKCFEWNGRERRELELRIKGDTTEVIIKPHKALWPFIAHSGRWPERNEFPFYWNGFYLGIITVRDRRKHDYINHNNSLFTVLHFLERSNSYSSNLNCSSDAGHTSHDLDDLTAPGNSDLAWYRGVYHLDLAPLIFEIAIDTVDPSHGDFIRMCACLVKPPSYNQIFHFIGRGESRKMLHGPASFGTNEYHGYRPKAPSDNRTNHERPEGGRRQLVSYDRSVPGHNYSFYRLEMRLYRAFLRDYTKRLGIIYTDQLLIRIRQLVEQNLTFKRIDLRRLYRDYQQTRTFSLSRFSTKGQIYILLQKGFGKNLIERYINKLPWPSITYIDGPYAEVDGTLLWHPDTQQNIRESAM